MCVNRADFGDGPLFSSVRGAGTNWVSGEERRERLGTETESGERGGQPVDYSDRLEQTQSSS